MVGMTIPGLNDSEVKAEVEVMTACCLGTLTRSREGLWAGVHHHPLGSATSGPCSPSTQWKSPRGPCLPITFTDKDFHAPDPDPDDLMVIMVEIARYNISKVLVDQGSSMNILY